MAADRPGTDRPGAGHHLLVGSAAALATWSALLSWRGLVEDASGYATSTAVLAGVLVVTGTMLRSLGLAGAVVVAGQATVLTLGTTYALVGSFNPLSAGGEALRTAIADAVVVAGEYAAPVPASVGVGIEPLIVLAGAVCLLVVDLVAVTLRRAALASLVLVALFSVAATMLDRAPAWWVFALSALGFLSVLFAQAGDEAGRWGRGSVGESARRRWAPSARRSPRIRQSAQVMAATATALALASPIVVPTLTLSVFDFGPGNGAGENISVTDPFVDLRRDLKQGPDRPAIDLVTDDPDPGYLRISVLTVYETERWRPGNRTIPTDNLPVGEMPALEGVDPALPRDFYEYEVSVTDNFSSTWLPTQPLISRIEAEGDWRFDDRTRDFIASDPDLTSAGLSYDMTAVDLTLASEALVDAASTPRAVDPLFSRVPAGLPRIVTSIARDVTAGNQSKFQKAVALQEWFRSNFTYDLAASPDGSDADTLESFLSPDGRVGYCEQFAASMAVMARVLDIPSRVAVGFLKPERMGQGRWQYSTHDLHAWPELYFDGFGWVRFEPTPSDRASGVPEYTDTRVEPGTPDLPTQEPSQAAPDRGPDAVEPSVEPEPEPEAIAPEDDTSATGVDWAALMRIAVGLGLLAALVLAPRLLRDRARRHRLGAGIEGAWRELAATGVDLGLDWPQNRSPRETRDTVVQWFGQPADEADTFVPERPARGPRLNPLAVAAIDRLTLALELERYAADADRSSGSATSRDVELVTRALVDGSTNRDRRRATWLPRSLVSRRGDRFASDEVDHSTAEQPDADRLERV